MRETDRICEQMMRAFEGGAWYGPSLMEVLRDVDLRLAAARPMPESHTIWEIVLHVSYGQGVLLRRVRGEKAEWDLSRDWPEMPTPTAEAWEAAIGELRLLESELRGAIAAFPEDRLDQPLDDQGSSAYDNLQGHVQHHAYHAGQIVMLKKAASSQGDV